MEQRAIFDPNDDSEIKNRRVDKNGIMAPKNRFWVKKILFPVHSDIWTKEDFCSKTF